MNDFNRLMTFDDCLKINNTWFNTMMWTASCGFLLILIVIIGCIASLFGFFPLDVALKPSLIGVLAAMACFLLSYSSRRRKAHWDEEIRKRLAKGRGEVN